MRRQYALALLMFASGVICIVTGILMDAHMIPGGKAMKGVFKNIHTYSGYIMAIGLCIHLYWHRSWIKAALRRAQKR